MKRPVKYYKHASTIEDADNKIIVDTSELTEDDAIFIEKAINLHKELYVAAHSMYHDLIALNQPVPEEAARMFGEK